MMIEVRVNTMEKVNTKWSSANKDLAIADLQKQLEAANQKLEILSKATNDAIWDWDLQTNSIVWNHGLKTLFGYDEKKVSHNYCTWADNIHVSDKDEVLHGLKAALNSGKLNWSAMYRYKCSNGSYKYTYDRGYIVYEGATPVRMIGAMQDIDERMTGMEEIEKLSMVASKTENLVIITDAEEKIEWVNEGFIKRTGYSLKEILGKSPRILQGPETDRAALDQIRKSIDACESVTVEVLNYTKDGSKFWIKININPVFDDAHKLIRLIAVETDITINKEYENKITSIAQELSGLIENANAVIFGIDRNGYINEWNKQAIVTTGYAKNDVLGQKLTRFVNDPERMKQVEKSIEYVLEGNMISLKEFQMVSRSGDDGILLLSATPRRNSSKEIIGVMAVGQDITELMEYKRSLEEKVKERTQALNKALLKEKQLVELKNQFVAIASHEFRTPLSTINFATNYLQQHFETLTGEDVKSKLKKIEKQVTHMTALLEDVIMAGRTELNKIPVFKARITLRSLIDRIVEEVQNSTKHTHQIHLQYDVTSLTLETDEKLLRNILVNLLSNAIKFSAGKESIDLNMREANAILFIEVSDKGIGIPDADQEKLFQSFYRGSNTSSIAGTGLGLSIVKKAVEILNGTLELKSQLNQGTIVSVTLPMNS